MIECRSATLNFNPRSPWGERLILVVPKAVPAAISIHALREESDVFSWLCATKCSISIHALREESDLLTIKTSDIDLEFQSTLSVRRATVKALSNVKLLLDFNPRSPWGERLAEHSFFVAYNILFQSTLSVRRATGDYQYNNKFSTEISIHALREESDWF